MNRLIKYRRFLLSLIGILPLIVSLGASRVAFAATSTSDISVTLIANRSTLKAGQTITYTAIMKNLGPDDASSVDVRFTLPAQLTLVSLTCDLGVTPDNSFCEYSSLKAGQTAISKVVAKLTPHSVTRERKVKATADILLEQDCAFQPGDCTLDPHLSNNLSSVTTKLIGGLTHP